MWTPVAATTENMHTNTTQVLRPCWCRLKVYNRPGEIGTVLQSCQLNRGFRLLVPCQNLSQHVGKQTLRPILVVRLAPTQDLKSVITYSLPNSLMLLIRIGKASVKRLELGRLFPLTSMNRFKCINEMVDMLWQWAKFV